MEYYKPWKLIESKMGFCHLIYDSEDRLVCTSEGNGGADTRKELANARLIASAPDLLAALEEISKIAGSAPGVPDSRLAECRRIARATRAKAGGTA